MYKRFTCDGCANRKVGCHSSCKKYLSELKEYREIQQKITDERIREYYYAENKRKWKAIKMSKNRKNG